MAVLASNMARANKAIRASGQYNFKGCRIQVPSRFKFGFLEAELEDYKDKEIISLLKYGCPIGYAGGQLKREFCINHKGARDFPRDVDEYLDKETSAGAIIGPFQNSSLDIEVVVSPLNTCPKKDTTERRIIGDLSFPKKNPHLSVNGGIDKYSYLGEKVNLRYPSISDLVHMVIKKGPGCALYKRDLRRAYRQIPVDPGDLQFLVYKWKGALYVDCALVMGLRSAALNCQRLTNAVSHILKKKGVDVVNYLDDIAGAESWNKADRAFRLLGVILQQCGIEESVAKACAPNTKMVFLGILVDTVAMSLEITKDRLQDIIAELQLWKSKVWATKREVQSLVGLLQFVASCVSPGRIFISRMLNFLRECPEVGKKEIPAEFLQDIHWWVTFLPKYNGISLIPELNWSDPDAEIACDACLEGAGGWRAGEYFHVEFPEFIKQQNLHINALEMITIIVALKVWARGLTRKRIVMHCDNLSTVVVLTTGRARDRFLQACLRELVYLQAQYNFRLKMLHIRGEENRKPDLLSRWSLGDRYRKEFFTQYGSEIVREVYVYEGLFEFTHDW